MHGSACIQWCMPVWPNNNRAINTKTQADPQSDTLYFQSCVTYHKNLASTTWQWTSSMRLLCHLCGRWMDMLILWEWMVNTCTFICNTHVLCFNEEEEDSPLFLTQTVGKSIDQSMSKEPLTILIRQLVTELLLSEGRSSEREPTSLTVWYSEGCWHA
jgi:hypothetical protein